MDLNRNVQGKSQFYKGHLQKRLGRREFPATYTASATTSTGQFLFSAIQLPLWESSSAGQNQKNHDNYLLSFSEPWWIYASLFILTCYNIKASVYSFFYVSLPMQDIGKCSLQTSVVRADMTKGQQRLWFSWGTPLDELQIEKKGQERY